VTNTHISPDDYLTHVSALDTSIFLSIADSAPAFPPSGSGLVYHGAQRLLFSYAMGLLAKTANVTSWQVFQAVVHALTFFTAGLFWRLSLRATSGNRHAATILTSMLICHPYLFRLELCFSGFVNDAIFSFGCTILTLSLLTRSLPLRLLAFAILIPAKQTVFVIFPALFLFEIFWGESSKRKTTAFWLTTIAATLVYYREIHILISPFSSPNTTNTMAFGLVNWIMTANNREAFAQLCEFIARGVLGLFPPIILFISIIVTGNWSKALSCNKKIIVLFLSAMAQPILSGPALTDASIQRLLSLGMAPFLVFLGYGIRNLRFRRTQDLLVVVALFAVNSSHHIFSRLLGPDLSLRYYFLAIYTICTSIIGVIIYRRLDDSSDKIHAK
jgi:hypothetical protein